MYQIPHLKKKEVISRPYPTFFVETPGKPTIIMALPAISTFTTTESVSNRVL
jgi:hypothetical protein